jgi:hypothetical protein
MKTFITLVVAIGMSVAIAVLFYKDKSKKGLVVHQVYDKELNDRYNALKDSVADLEQKARILNNYLNVKHLEYIEVCNLVHKSSKKD